MKRFAADLGSALAALTSLMLLGVAADGSGPMPHWLVCYLAGLSFVSVTLLAIGMTRDE